MAEYNLYFVYKMGDIEGLADLETGRFTIKNGSKPSKIKVKDTCEISDEESITCKLLLNQAFDGHQIGASIVARALSRVGIVGEGDKLTETLLIQLHINGETYYEFQSDVMPEAQIHIQTWEVISGENPRGQPALKARGTDAALRKVI